MDAYEEWAESAKYATPTGACPVAVNMVGFVDDNTGQNNDFFGEPNRAKIDEIIEQAMKNAQFWFELLSASGGSLEYSKCCIHFQQRDPHLSGCMMTKSSNGSLSITAQPDFPHPSNCCQPIRLIKLSVILRNRQDHNRSNFASSRNSATGVQPSCGSAP